MLIAQSLENKPETEYYKLARQRHCWLRCFAGKHQRKHALRMTRCRRFGEIILAISPTIEGDTTMFYITKTRKGSPVSVSSIARGVSFGGELEYADEVTLGRSIVARVPYKLDNS